MPTKRTRLILYAVQLREHPEIVKMGRTTNWKSRRRAYDTWNFAAGDGLANGRIYTITEEYVDLAALESECLGMMSLKFPLHRGNEWFKAALEDGYAVIEGVLQSGAVSYEAADLTHRAA